MKKLRNLLILVTILAVLSIAAYGVSKITQVTDDIGLEEITDCKTVYWDESVDVYGNCTQYYNTTVCDESNTTCQEVEQSYNYTCKTGSQTVQKSKEVCEDKEMRVTLDRVGEDEEYLLEYGKWGKCSYEAEDETLIITCDSKYDGNNDGICTSGESCTQFRITKDSIKRMIKNSRDDFAEHDSSFFLEELSMEAAK